MTRGPERQVKRKDVKKEFTPGIPETATSLSRHFDCHPDTIMNRLKELNELGDIQTKKLGERGRVWWIPAPGKTVDVELIKNEMFRSGKDPGILRVMAESLNENSEPVTSTDIANAVDDTQDIIYNRLRKLDERGWVESLKAGSTSKVWWLNKDKLETEADTTPEDVADSDVETDADSNVEANADFNSAPEGVADSPSGSETEGNVELGGLKDRLDEVIERAGTEYTEDVQTLLEALLSILEDSFDEEQSQTSLSVSEALKNHLREVAGKTEAKGVEGVETLQEALIHILENPHDEKQSLTGYEEKLNDPIKVSRETRDKLRALRDLTGARDYEEAIRERANIERRNTGEEPVDVSNWSE